MRGTRYLLSRRPDAAPAPWDALVAGFEAQNPDLKIHIVPTPWDTHEQKILAAFNPKTLARCAGRARRFASP